MQQLHQPSTLGLVFDDAELERELRAGLDAVEEHLRQSVKSSYPFVTETSLHLVDAGGKRFRPLLVLLAAQFGDPAAPGVVPAAVVVELTHLATLYHDDVMDEAAVRRGAASANSRWGNSIAILTGDFLFARASDILADLGPECVRIQARTFERLVHGQIRETVGPELDGDPIEHYLRVLADKTGSLIGTSARFGAMLAGADEAIAEILTRYGERIGVAFQLSDDLLDVVSETGQSGKTPGHRPARGRGDAAGAAARPHHRPGVGPAAARCSSGPIEDDAEVAEALTLLRAHPVLDQARDVLRSWADEALDAIAPLADSTAKSALAALCEYVVARTG